MLVGTEDSFVVMEDPGVYAEDCAGWEKGFLAASKRRPVGGTRRSSGRERVG